MSDKLFKMTVASAMLTGSIVAMAPTAQAAEAVTFKDVSKSMASYEAIMNLTQRGVISGYTDSTFRPAEDVTRGQAAKFIAGIMNLDTSKVVDPKFTDVPKSHPFYKYIAALNQEKVIQGYGNDKYGVNDKLTRGQMAIIIGKAFGFEEKELVNDKFVDVNKKLPYAQYVQALIDYDITRGLTSTKFGPYEFVDRAQMAIFLYRGDKAKDGVEITGKVTSVKGSEVVIGEGKYLISDSVKAILNEKNAPALKGAEVTLQVKDGKVIAVTSLELKASGTAASPLVFDGEGSTLTGHLTISGTHLSIGNFTVNGTVMIGDSAVSTAKVVADSAISFNNVDFKVVQVEKKSPVTIEFRGTSKITKLNVLSNINLIGDKTVTIPSVDIFKGADNVTLDAPVASVSVHTPDELTLTGDAAIGNITLETAAPVAIETTGKVDNLVIKVKGAVVSLGTSTKVGDMKLPSGTEAKDVIKNYDTVKDNIEKVDGEKNEDVKPTPPVVTPPVVTPPTTSAKDKFNRTINTEVVEVNKKIKDLATIGTIGTNNHSVVTIKDSDAILRDLSSTGLIGSLISISEIRSFNLGGKTYTIRNNQGVLSLDPSEIKSDLTDYINDQFPGVTKLGQLSTKTITVELKAVVDGQNYTGVYTFEFKNQ
ncbi:S-layer homology domain-containing protein [Sporosarcina sp. A2]|uniref:S-layer homology domain-containing protein n=1 Tax=Sporosarcina sp. A2 TaxID=3393449 RepID=UPI003D79D555